MLELSTLALILVTCLCFDHYIKEEEICLLEFLKTPRERLTKTLLSFTLKY